MDLIKYETLFNQKFEILKKKFKIIQQVSNIFIIIFTKRKNNIFITITNLYNKVIFKTSSGFEGFKNSVKSSPFILHYICQNLIRRLLRLKIQSVIFKFKGVSKNYRKLLRILKNPDKFFGQVELNEMNLKLDICQIIIIPKIPFGGCKLRKQKRR